MPSTFESCHTKSTTILHGDDWLREIRCDERRIRPERDYDRIKASE